MPKEFDIGYTVTLPEGNPYIGTYTFRLRDATGLDDLDVRRETGFTLIGLFREQYQDVGMMAVVAAVVVWLERRKTFPHNTFQDIARTITWGSDFEIEDIDGQPELEDDAGKAPESEESSP